MEKIRDVAFIATSINCQPYEVHYLTQDDETVYKLDISKRRTNEIDSNDFIDDVHCTIAYANLNKDDDEEINIFLDDSIKESIVSSFEDDIRSAEDTIKELNEVIKNINRGEN